MIKNKTIPFHYEVRFHLLAINNENDVKPQSYIKSFNTSNLLKNRIDAFKVFEEYVTFIKSVNRLSKDLQGNYVITQPTFIEEILEDSKEDYLEWLKNLEHFTEEISVYLVVNEEQIARDVCDAFEYEGEIETEFVIHKISSREIERQYFADNLELHELVLYEHFNIDVSALRETIFHYGMDYAESGEDVESGAKRTILKTPMIWYTLEDYEKIYKTEESNKEAIAENISIENKLFNIIQRGETSSIEFKSSLLYNFKTAKAGISVKHEIARTICGFLNTEGGLLFVGVRDDRSIQGLEYDYSLFENENVVDKLFLELDSLIASFLGISLKPLIKTYLGKLEGKDVLLIVVNESHKPVFLINRRNERVYKEFYIRMNASTHQIRDVENIIDYVFNKKWKK